MSTPSASGLRSQSNSGGSTPQPHHALPARPPPPANPNPAVPVHYGAGSRAPRTAMGSGAYGSQNVNGTIKLDDSLLRALTKWIAAAPNFPNPYPQPTVTATASLPYPSVAAANSANNVPYAQAQYQSTYQPAYSVTPPQPTGSYSAAAATDDDPELRAQMAEWQTGFSSKDDSKKGTASANNAAAAHTGTAADGSKTVVREGGGKTWEDPTLLDWNPAHFRLFVGNLAGEVTDDSLARGFQEYPSVTKTHVVRDKRTNKSKGYGFVAFSDSDDYFKAFREKQNKYIGGHPVQLKKANDIRTAPWANRNSFTQNGNRNQNGNNRFNRSNGNNNKSGGGNRPNKTDADRSSTGSSGPGSYAGVSKHKDSKKKGGLKLLG